MDLGEDDAMWLPRATMSVCREPCAEAQLLDMWLCLIGNQPIRVRLHSLNQINIPWLVAKIRVQFHRGLLDNPTGIPSRRSNSWKTLVDDVVPVKIRIFVVNGRRGEIPWCILEGEAVNNWVMRTQVSSLRCSPGMWSSLQAWTYYDCWYTRTARLVVNRALPCPLVEPTMVSEDYLSVVW